MPVNPTIIKRILPENSVLNNKKNLNNNENVDKKLDNLKSNTTPSNTKANSPINKKTIHFVEAKKINVNNEPHFSQEVIIKQNNVKESKLTVSYSNVYTSEVTREDLLSILSKLKEEAKDYIIVRRSLLLLLEDLISKMPTKEHLKQMHQNMISLNDRIKYLDNLNNFKDKNIVSLEKELSSRNNNITELKKEIHQWKDNIEKLKSQIKELTDYVNRLEKRNEKNNEIINNNNKELDHYKNKLEDNKIEINSLMKKHDTEIKKIKYSIEECKNILVDRDSTIDQLQTKLKELQEKYDDLNNKHNIELNSKNELIQKNQSIQKMLNDLKQIKDNLSNKLKSDNLENKKKIFELNNECINYENRMKEIQNLLQNKENKLKDLKKNNDELYDKFTSDIMKNKKKIDKLNNDCANYEKKLKYYQELLKDKDMKLDNLKRDNEDLYDKYDFESKEYLKKIDELNNKNAKFEKKLRDYQRLLQGKGFKLNDLKNNNDNNLYDEYDSESSMDHKNFNEVYNKKAHPEAKNRLNDYQKLLKSKSSKLNNMNNNNNNNNNDNNDLYDRYDSESSVDQKKFDELYNKNTNPESKKKLNDYQKLLKNKDSGPNNMKKKDNDLYKKYDPNNNMNQMNIEELNNEDIDSKDKKKSNDYQKLLKDKGPKFYNPKKNNNDMYDRNDSYRNDSDRNIDQMKIDEIYNEDEVSKDKKKLNNYQKLLKGKNSKLNDMESDNDNDNNYLYDRYDSERSKNANPKAKRKLNDYQKLLQNKDSGPNNLKKRDNDLYKRYDPNNNMNQMNIEELNNEYVNSKDKKKSNDYQKLLKDKDSKFYNPKKNNDDIYGRNDSYRNDSDRNIDQMRIDENYNEDKIPKDKKKLNDYQKLLKGKNSKLNDMENDNDDLYDRNDSYSNIDQMKINELNNENINPKVEKKINGYQRLFKDKDYKVNNLKKNNNNDLYDKYIPDDNINQKKYDELYNKNTDSDVKKKINDYEKLIQDNDSKLNDTSSNNNNNNIDLYDKYNSERIMIQKKITELKNEKADPEVEKKINEYQKLLKDKDSKLSKLKKNNNNNIYYRNDSDSNINQKKIDEIYNEDKIPKDKKKLNDYQKLLKGKNSKLNDMESDNDDLYDGNDSYSNIDQMKIDELNNENINPKVEKKTNGYQKLLKDKDSKLNDVKNNNNNDLYDQYNSERIMIQKKIIALKKEKADPEVEKKINEYQKLLKDKDSKLNNLINNNNNNNMYDRNDSDNYMDQMKIDDMNNDNENYGNENYENEKKINNYQKLLKDKDSKLNDMNNNNNNDLYDQYNSERIMIQKKIIALKKEKADPEVEKKINDYQKLLEDKDSKLNTLIKNNNNNNNMYDRNDSDNYMDQMKIDDMNNDNENYESEKKINNYQKLLKDKDSKLNDMKNNNNNDLYDKYNSERIMIQKKIIELKKEKADPEVEKKINDYQKLLEDKDSKLNNLNNNHNNNHNNNYNNIYPDNNMNQRKLNEINNESGDSEVKKKINDYQKLLEDNDAKLNDMKKSNNDIYDRNDLDYNTNQKKLDELNKENTDSEVKKKINEYQKLLQNENTKLNGMKSNNDNNDLNDRYDSESIMIQRKIIQINNKNSNSEVKKKINDYQKMLQDEESRLNVNDMKNKNENNELYDKYNLDSNMDQMNVEELNNKISNSGDKKKLNNYQRLLQDRDSNLDGIIKNEGNSNNRKQNKESNDDNNKNINRYSNSNANINNNNNNNIQNKIMMYEKSEQYKYEKIEKKNVNTNDVDNQIRKRSRDFSYISNDEKRFKLDDGKWKKIVKLTNKLYKTVHSKTSDNSESSSSSNSSS
ncbi:hypothetical protein H8356DRAFT_9057 [Neocallimastix lanati (nom. inval.)]|nr:hypothetical protein H8356DRAFT_9057 [Neocallimastix sp. JGI-2020a]